MVEKRGTDDRLASEYNIAYTSSRCVEVSNAVRNGLGKMNQCAGCIGRREDIDLMLMSLQTLVYKLFWVLPFKCKHEYKAYHH